MKGKRKWTAVFIDLCAMLATVIVYGLLKIFLAAPYFTGLYDTRWLHAFKDQGIIAGLSYCKSIIVSKSVDIYFRIGLAFERGYQSDGAFFFIYIILTVLLLIALLSMLFRKKFRYFLPLLHITLCMIVLFIAIEMMYKPYEGSKHLLAFIMPAFLLLLAVLEKEFVRPMVYSGIIALSFIMVLIAKRPYQADYVIPYSDGSMDAENAYWQDVFDKKISPEKTGEPSYNNTIICVYGDEAANANSLEFNPDCWPLLYDATPGMGINYCLTDYVTENFDSLKSRYIATPSNGTIDALLSSSAAWTEVGRSDRMALYMKN
ncbi:MAG: hypothetical protein K5669_02475 [Lachnospiraceae bacterium]|nr:hypothetical protein [Lachnospiraceae bacterium]